jgi:hypothetical protein
MSAARICSCSLGAAPALHARVTIFHQDKVNNILTGYVVNDESVDYFGYMKKNAADAAQRADAGNTACCRCTRHGGHPSQKQSWPPTS